MTNIDKHFYHFEMQAMTSICVCTLVLWAVGSVWLLAGMMAPVVVGSVFSIVVVLADGLTWRKIAQKAPDSLPTFFMAVSGVRMLLALAVMFVYYFVAGSQSMLMFFLVFMAYYIVILVHHTIFFAKDRTAANEQKK